MQTATIITIGDELLIGQVVDTNSAYMAVRLSEQGVSVKEILSVHDEREAIVSALERAISQSEIVLLTGGLGPTKDDITKHVLCEFFSTYLVENKQVEAHVKDLYKNRPEVLNRLTATQWQVPATAQIIENKIGSAPIMLFRREGTTIVSMPGVPEEMRCAMDTLIAEKYLADTASKAFILHRTLRVAGIPESALAILIEQWETNLPKNLHLAYLPQYRTIRLRLSGTGNELDRLTHQLDTEFQTLQSLVSEYVVAQTGEPLEVVLGSYLKAHNMTVASAESCTGGKVASLLNKHAGSSAFYKGSVVSYSNEVKEQVLGVCKTDLEQYGAVSEQVVGQMAKGVIKVLQTDCAIATSGIAGPDGGTKEKPVGTVWIAVAKKTADSVGSLTADAEGISVYTECLHLRGDREAITDNASAIAILRLLQWLEK